VAHEDIHPTLEWQVEIERALYNMDAFLAIHTPGFKDSFWTQQEIGFAVGRGMKIFPSRWVKTRQVLFQNSKLLLDVAGRRRK
jgi:hypothetical protein